MTYKCIALDFYVTDCRNTVHAVRSFLHYGIGVTISDVEPFEGEIPEGSRVMKAI